MSKIIDPASRQKAGSLYLAAVCPQCNNPIYAHVVHGGKQALKLFPTCPHEEEGMGAQVPSGDDVEYERYSIRTIFALVARQQLALATLNNDNDRLRRLLARVRDEAILDEGVAHAVLEAVGPRQGASQAH